MESQASQIPSLQNQFYQQTLSKAETVLLVDLRAQDIQLDLIKQQDQQQQS